nr:MAG TPA: hypothetical protein [Caudoviricetes sp.]
MNFPRFLILATRRMYNERSDILQKTTRLLID